MPKTISKFLQKEPMTEVIQMENYFLSFPELYQDYDPENEQYKAALKVAK